MRWFGLQYAESNKTVTNRIEFQLYQQERNTRTSDETDKCEPPAVGLRGSPAPLGFTTILTMVVVPTLCATIYNIKST